jgi:hypothetical protein
MRFFLACSIAFLVGTSFFLPYTFAEDRCANNANAANDITCLGFKINLVSIDPVGSGNPVTGWTAAATGLLDKIAGLLLFLVPIIAGVSMIIAGYYYILSSGDSEKAQIAKTIIKWNLVAIFVALFSYAIIVTIAAFLDGTPLN